MKSWKVILEQAKDMKSTWPNARGGGAGCVRFQGDKKRSAEGEELNDLVANAVKSVLNTNKRKNSKGSSDSDSEYNQ